MSSPGYRPTPAAASQLNLRGAVDLSSLRRPAAPPAPSPSASADGGSPAAGTPQGGENGKAPLRVDATETNFQDLVQLSAQIPVLFLLWSRYAPESPAVLEAAERVVETYGGRLVLAAADVDTFPQLAQAFQVQAVPTAVAVVKGQPVPLFQGPADDEQIRNLVEELLKVAAANGVTGSIGEAGEPGEDPEPAPLPPLHQAAIDAIEAGDYAGAIAAYKQALLEQPADTDAKAGLVQVELMARLEKLSAPEAESLRHLAATEPDNIQAQLTVADLDISGGHIDDAFNRIISFIGRNFGPERETARVRLLELFEVVGTQDERVAKARQGLARVLF
ncbi:tetratricopeptide repeat protein [Paenarthrobacter sp. TYUT067]|uniref:tetratricopeptide repeat protein n=1 Tax=Paenarthrobacter sp. TYUT067 TaxID=2926245 RepID=UPI00202EE17D|nr:tetratricopeptide repeat protein [Paenarthrobacter sp. TYUT067]MCM0614838.1 tetratricopeptide repeat protein [Paenarthrobacter sp. TYUT067]